MKKFGFMMMAAAVAAFTLSSCNPKPNPDIDDIVENGFYVTGEAVAMPNLVAQGQFAVGHNEANNNELREGMYEKYVVIEAGKEFTFAKKEGELIVKYTAQLAKQELISDGTNPMGYFGNLAEGTAAMKVEETGLYHIVLDLNQDGKLDAAGGPQVIIAPVSWGISGGMNGWSMTVGTKAANDYVWTWENVEIPGNSEFKFKDENGWKIFLDGETQQVSANTNLGQNMVPGAGNIAVAEGGVYNIKLTWKLAKGNVEDGYTYELVKAGDLTLDPATFVVGISGEMNGWGDPEGVTLAKYNAEKSNVTDAATKAGSYVYNMTGVSFADGQQFKFRANGAWLGLADVTAATGVELAENGGNITLTPAGAYDIEITLVWDGNGIASFSAAFVEGEPVEPVEYIEDYFYLLNEGTFTDINVYGWAPNKDNNNEIFGAWPGTRVTGDATTLTRVFFEKAIKGGEYKFIINGTGGQTADPDWVVSFDDPNVHHTLKVTADNQLVVVE